MKFYSYLDGKPFFSQIFLGLVFFIFFFFFGGGGGGGGGGGRVDKSPRLSPVVKGKVWQYYAPVICIHCPLHLQGLVAIMTFQSLALCLWGQADANPALCPILHNQEVNP